MSKSRYQDVIWNFVPVGLGGASYDRRTFASEDELFVAWDRLRKVELTERTITGTPFNPPSGDHASPRSSAVIKRCLRPEEASRLGDVLWKSLGAPVLPESPQSKPTRIKICSPSSEITDMPWECLTNGSAEHLALRKNVHIVRSVPARYPLPLLTVVPPLRVVLILTQPKEERMLRPDQELAAVQSRLQGNGYTCNLTIDPAVESLRKLLADVQPHIVHYIGHSAMSAGQGCIVLLDERGRTYWLAGTELSRMLPSSVRLVCLSTCFTALNYDIRGFSRLAHAPADVMLPNMLINQIPLSIHAGDVVGAFWTEFYEALLQKGGDVTQAVWNARTACHQALPLDYPAHWASFSFVIRDGSGRGFSIIDKDDRPDRHKAELEALYMLRLANLLNEQSGAVPTETSELLDEQSRAEAKRALDLLRMFKRPSDPPSTADQQFPPKSRDDDDV